MCGEVVAAPLSLQDTVYPILRKKSLHFCEKSKKFLKLCTAVRKKYKTKRLRRRTNSLRQNLSVLPAPSGWVRSPQAASPSQSPTVTALPKGEPLAVHANFISLPRPLPLGEVARRSRDGEGEDTNRRTLTRFSSAPRAASHAPHSGQRCADWLRSARRSPA